MDGQPEIATCHPTGSTYISDSITDITTVSTRASSQKVSTSDYNIQRQPEIAIWPPKPEIDIPLELRQDDNSNGKSGVFNYVQCKETDSG